MNIYFACENENNEKELTYEELEKLLNDPENVDSINSWGDH